jgi:hypothetical protein
MLMRRRSESCPQLSASYLFAQMSVSEESDLSPSKTGRTQERDPSIDVCWRPRPKTWIYSEQGGSVGRSAKDADLRKAERLSLAVFSERRSDAPSNIRNTAG